MERNQNGQTILENKMEVERLDLQQYQSKKKYNDQ